MAGIHMENPATPEGKYLVVRRDGTVPQWPHFVLGARDKSAATALRSYSRAVAADGLDKEYADGVDRLATRFVDYNMRHGDGQPDAASQVVDSPVVVAMMQFRFDLSELIQTFDMSKKFVREFVEHTKDVDVKNQAGIYLPWFVALVEQARNLNGFLDLLEFAQNKPA